MVPHIPGLPPTFLSSRLLDVYIYFFQEALQQPYGYRWLPMDEQMQRQKIKRDPWDKNKTLNTNKKRHSNWIKLKNNASSLINYPTWKHRTIPLQFVWTKDFNLYCHVKKKCRLETLQKVWPLWVLFKFHLQIQMSRSQNKWPVPWLCQQSTAIRQGLYLTGFASLQSLYHAAMQNNIRLPHFNSLPPIKFITAAVFVKWMMRRAMRHFGKHW